MSNFAAENRKHIIMSNTIGFSNFRRFTSFPEIDLGDITILVGGNNAGKSTLVKAMLLMRDFLKSRIESVDKTENIFQTIRPQFKFDAEHVNVGEFYRAFCRQSPSEEDTMSFSMKIDKFLFAVNIRGERRPGVVPEVSMITVTDEDRDITFTFDFSINQMTVHFSYDRKALNSYDSDKKNSLLKEEKRLIDRLKDLESELSKYKDLEKITAIKVDIDKTYTELGRIKAKRKVEEQSYIGYSIDEYDSVTINMSFFIGDNIGEYVITELINGFVNYAYTGTTGDKRSKEYKEQIAHKSFLKGKETEIKAVSKEIENVLNRQTIEYIYAHSVSQTPFYANCIGSSDYTKRTIHEFYNSRISSGDEKLGIPKDDEFILIEEWLKKFKIGNSLRLESHAGDSYQVFIIDDDNPKGIDLADKGMGSIQLVILLLRLATLIRKYKGQELTILLEEPEQNLHPAVQSMLADLINTINKEYKVRFIIETHSEYLVRHTQVLAAKYFKEGRSKLPFKVFYLTGNNDHPYDDMGFQKNGKFNKAFGPGFFNVADDAAMELFDLDDDIV